jgi:ATP-dependent DNA helicase DinG
MLPVRQPQEFSVHEPLEGIEAEDNPAPLEEAEAKTPRNPAMDMPALFEANLADFFGPDGPLAQQFSGYELRPSQLQMAEAVRRALLAQHHALIEAPTGTGKSIAYLAPAILAGKTVVVATANKSLQNQLFKKDIPFLEQVFGHPIAAIVVKGRSNFVCTHKWDKELVEQRTIALYDREDPQTKYMREWLAETATGDIDDLPFMLNSELRPRLVSYPDDCLHSQCRFAEDQCWVNHMRDQAANAQVVITNHHLLLNALELGEAGERILPPAAIYIIDEAHQLEETATAVYEVAATDYTVPQLLSRTVYKEFFDEDEMDEVRFQNILAFQEVANLGVENSFQVEQELEGLKQLASALRGMAQRMKENGPKAADDGDVMVEKEAGSKGKAKKKGKNSSATSLASPDETEARVMHDLGIEALNSVAGKLSALASAGRDDDTVRYAVRVFDRRHVSIELHSAPINPAGLLSRFLFAPQEKGERIDRTVICTSATLTTGGSFEHFKQRCGLAEVGEEHTLPQVFDYPNQALLYQPQLPAFNFANAAPYYDGVAREIERLLEVSRGRSLCLFTSWSGLQQVNDRLQRLEGGVIWPLRAQGDAPRNTLLDWFMTTPNSVLLATRSFWEGVDIPGDGLSLVVMDKLPFPTPNDPLHAARMRALEAEARNSFNDYTVPLMTLTLKQGFGRLIRRAADRGVVAILDERLSTKNYGRQVQRDLPPARFGRDFKDVHRFFQIEFQPGLEFALNVWAQEDFEQELNNPFAGGSGRVIRWRWQLLRLQDGKSDSAEGVVEKPSMVEGEVHAMLAGLDDLRQRVEKAGRTPKQYAVEIRCTVDGWEWVQGYGAKDPVWQAIRQQWQEVTLLPLIHDVPSGF